MKTTIITALLLVLSLGGCTTVDDPPTKQGTTSREAPAEATTSDYTDEELSAVLGDLLRSEHPSEFKGVGNDLVMGTAKAMCSGFDTGMTFAEAVGAAIRVGYSARAAGFFVGASIAAFCPEHNDVVP